MDKRKLYRYVGNEEQLYGVRRVILEEGSGRGSTLYQVTTAGGLDFDVTADCGLDLGRLRYKGVNMSYLTKNGYDAPSRFLPVPGGFDHTFPGGMMYTCGLLSVGPECVDEAGVFHPLHGRFHGQPASGCYGFVEGDAIVVGGTVRETTQFRHALRMTRRVTAPVWGSELLIEDRLENLTPHDEQYMLLYHCNFGYPLLDEHTRVVLPEGRNTIPRSEYSAAGLAEQCLCTPPVDGERERVYFNEIHECPRALVVNPALGVQVELTWSLDTLPILSQWKNLKSGDYALALEPSTCYTAGRCVERAQGTLSMLRAFGAVEMWVRLKFSDLEVSGDI